VCTVGFDPFACKEPASRRGAPQRPSPRGGGLNRWLSGCSSQRQTGSRGELWPRPRRCGGLLRSASNAIRPVALTTLLGDDTPVRASERPASSSGVEQMLSGGDPRSLHGVDRVIAAVLADPSALEALFECLFCDDSVVRMRAGDALEKIARVRPELLAPFTRRLLSDVVDIDQPSIQWHLAHPHRNRADPAAAPARDRHSETQPRSLRGLDRAQSHAPRTRAIRPR
jgi:hypothetical protein